MSKLAALHNKTVSLMSTTKHKLSSISSLCLVVLLSSFTKKTPSRSRRSLLPFYRRHSKGLFGTATSADLKNVARHVNSIQRAQINLSNKFTHQVELMSSFMSTTNNRLNNAISGIETNTNMINALRQEMATNTDTLQAQQNWLLSLL